MNNPSTSGLLEDIGETLGYVESIIDRKVKLAKLNATEQMAQLTSTLATGFILLGIFFVVICVFTLALGFLIVENFDWSYAGSFFALTTVYILIGIILYVLRHKLFTDPIVTIILRKIYKNQ